MPDGVIAPFALRDRLSVMRLGWPGTMSDAVRPTAEFLKRRKFDPFTWSARLPAFGPEALLVQLAIRPSSFVGWVELALRFDRFCASIDPAKLLQLLAGQNMSVWQRMAYMLHVGGNRGASYDVVQAYPSRKLSHVVIRANARSFVTFDPRESIYNGRFRVTDRVLVPLIRAWPASREYPGKPRTKEIPYPLPPSYPPMDEDEAS